ncbi:MAG: hypothetical protein ACPLYF_04250 [Fervidobacterium sp.]
MAVMFYTQNKVALITAFIEEYKKDNDHPPDKLQEIETNLRMYLSKHPDFKKQFLLAPWTDKEIPLFKIPIRDGFSFKYSDIIFIRNGNDYYLYFPQRIMKKTCLNEDDLKLIASNPNDHSIYLKYEGFVVINNGRIVFGMLKKNKEPFSLGNLNVYLTECPKGTPLWYFF